MNKPKVFIDILFSGFLLTVATQAAIYNENVLYSALFNIVILIMVYGKLKLSTNRKETFYSYLGVFVIKFVDALWKHNFDMNYVSYYSPENEFTVLIYALIIVSMLYWTYDAFNNLLDLIFKNKKLGASIAVTIILVAIAQLARLATYSYPVLLLMLFCIAILTSKILIYHNVFNKKK